MKRRILGASSGSSDVKAPTRAEADLCLMQQSRSSGPLLTHDTGTVCKSYCTPRT